MTMLLVVNPFTQFPGETAVNISEIWMVLYSAVTGEKK